MKIIVIIDVPEPTHHLPTAYVEAALIAYRKNQVEHFFLPGNETVEVQWENKGEK